MDIDPTTPPAPVATTTTRTTTAGATVPVVQTWWFWTAIAAIIIVVIVIIIIIVLTTRKPKSSSADPLVLPTLCSNSGEQVPLYIQLSNNDDYAFMSTQRSVSGATVQNNGDPELILCASAGPARIPIYAYVNPNDGADNRWGTSNVAPSYYHVGNGGLPIGYIYTTKKVGNVDLRPVYEVVHNFNNDLTHTGILSHQTDPTYGGQKYARVSNTPLGYSL